MIGGFLGAGKTTAVAKLARRLTDQGLKVGLITNDQGSQLVDTALLGSRGFAVEEIPGGCFCCRFNSLVEAARRLTTQTRPDVFIAEPVGSCTDLVATVSYPLRRIYGKEFAIAPLSVLVDPIRALRVFGSDAGAQFSEKVKYIYRKQLEEADIIVINKCDLLEPNQKTELNRLLREKFPRSEVLEASARDGTGLDAWFTRITTGKQSSRPAIEVDYEVYAEGEALLGWLNATVDVQAAGSVDGNALLRHLAEELQRRLGAAGAEVAHLKMTLDPKEGIGDLAVINLVRNDYVPELSQELQDPLESGQIVVNIRAETAPENLQQALEASLLTCPKKFPELEVKLEHLEQFRPGKPQPTHRFAGTE